MATACIINRYHSYSDRGAFVQKEPVGQRFVDETQLKIGEPLPRWDNRAPIVKVYDETHLELEYKGKTFSIQAGDEQLLDEGILSQNYGVTLYSLTTVKVLSTEIVYKGGWQQGSTVSQKLEGPIGNGEVHYPNGDHFKGYFHLSYAHISGPAYAADGRYEFADGSYIERAWIDTSEKRKPEFWGLHGVFRIHHPDGQDSIAMFCGGQRYGLELYLHETAWRCKVYEWYANEEVIRWQCDAPEKRQLEVVGYELDDTRREGCATLTLTVKDDSSEYRIVQEGGRYTANKYDGQIYEPWTHVTVLLPGGDSIDHYGRSLRKFMPYDGYVTMHDAEKGMCRSELWEMGKLKKADEWKRDERAAKSVEIPDPFGQGKVHAEVWRDGYIEYGYGEWVYEGEVAYDRPQGKGVLTGGNYPHAGERYAGEFMAGRCHGRGVYVNETADIRQDGQWKDGVFQEPHAAPAPIILHAKYGCKEWSVSSSGEWEWKESDIEAALGVLPFIGFGNVKIARIEQDCITLTRYDEKFLLKSGQTVSFYAEIEGREWSDGCVYDGTDYQLLLTWVTKNSESINVS